MSAPQNQAIARLEQEDHAGAEQPGPEDHARSIAKRGAAGGSFSAPLLVGLGAIRPQPIDIAAERVCKLAACESAFADEGAATSARHSWRRRHRRDDAALADHALLELVQP